MVLYDYVAFGFFTLVAVLLPILLVLFSKTVRKKAAKNAVKSSPYESAEASTGSNRDSDIEFLPYAMLFLPFELVAIIILLWSQSAKQSSIAGNVEMVVFLVTATLLAMVCLKLIRDEHG